MAGQVSEVWEPLPRVGYSRMTKPDYDTDEINVKLIVTGFFRSDGTEVAPALLTDAQIELAVQDYRERLSELARGEREL